MPYMRALTVVLAVLTVSSGVRAADEATCKTAAYVEQCLMIARDQAAEAACSSKPCETIVADLKQGCETIRKGMQGKPAAPQEEGGEPPFCKAHLGN